MKKVYICSPLRGDITGNIERAINYCKEAEEEDVLPIAPHIYFTRFMDDTIPEKRERAMKMGIELLDMCDELWIYGDTISEGMRAEIDYFEEHYNRKIAYKNNEQDKLYDLSNLFSEIFETNIKFVDVTNEASNE